MEAVYEQVRNLAYNSLGNYIDIDFTLWLSWLLTPLLITLLLPLVIVLLLYVTALILYIYKLHWKHVRSTYDSGDKWGAAREVVTALWDAHGWIWHGYEVRGIENIDDKEPALFIYYHGAIPIDLYYFIAKVILFKKRLVHTVADYFLFKIPGTVQSCSNVLKEGNLLAIAPGGVYEAQFSVNYSLLWKSRLGFAKVALDAKVPIIPMFTENVREAFRSLSVGRRFFLRIYASIKFPCTPIYGGFPVKMITHVGKPIPYDPSLTPEALQSKVADALNKLISEHQRLPGSIAHGLLDRIPYLRRKNDLLKHK